jgi:2'-5' RNA ligase
VSDITSKRLFFALWPENVLAKELYSLAQTCATVETERVIAARQMHLTLRYIGNVNTEKLICLTEIAQNITVSQFDISLQNLGYWKTPRVIWMAPENRPDSLTQLVFNLEQGCQDCGIKAEAKPFSPHVTLVRKARKLPVVNRQATLLWRVTDFVLVESKSTDLGVEYRILNHWPLH